MKPSKAISRYMAAIGSKGGKTTGPTKARDSEAMRRAGRLGAAKRKENAALRNKID